MEKRLICAGIIILMARVQSLQGVIIKNSSACSIEVCGKFAHKADEIPLGSVGAKKTAEGELQITQRLLDKGYGELKALVFWAQVGSKWGKQEVELSSYSQKQLESDAMLVAIAADLKIKIATVVKTPILAEHKVVEKKQVQRDLIEQNTVHRLQYRHECKQGPLPKQAGVKKPSARMRVFRSAVRERLKLFNSSKSSVKA